MSFRSALVNPSQNSGRVGEQLFGVGTTTTTTLVNAVNATIDTITLDKGTWNVVLSGTITLTSATITGQFIFKLSPGAVGASTFIDTVLSANVAQSTVYSPSSSVIVVVTAPTVFTLFNEATFTGTSIVVTKPSSVGNHYLTATKLA